MQLVSADAMEFSKNFKIFFAPENIKKLTSKVAHNQPSCCHWIILSKFLILDRLNLGILDSVIFPDFLITEYPVDIPSRKSKSQWGQQKFIFCLLHLGSFCYMYVSLLGTMATRVVEFSSGGYKIRKIFA